MRRGLPLLLLLVASSALVAGLFVGDLVWGASARGHGYVQRLVMPSATAEIGLPAIAGPRDAGRPLVVIDAGHGGHDPGAGQPPLQEKALTLQLALALRDALVRGGGIRVALTRDDDRFLLLPERAGIARRLHADLFLSIHADSVEHDDETGGGARGANTYTLSERGTSETARRLATQENRADTINGVSLANTSDTVSAILVELSQRETQAKSEAFARLILREAKGRLPLHDDEVQAAAFVVLKAPDMPSVLLESGYISNPDDARRLASGSGRADFAEVTAQAIRLYFARQSRP